MSTPYDREDRVITSGTDEIVEFDYPGRCEITRINVVREGGGAIDLDFFNRKFTSDAKTIRHISKVSGGPFDGKTRLHFFAEFGVSRPGDQIAVAGNSVAGYNVTHRVEKVSDDKLEVITDRTYTADGFGGTAALAIAAADQELYRVLPNQSSGSPLSVIPPATGDVVAYRNQDPLPNANIGVKRKIYIKIAAAATYRIAISSLLNVAGEG
jgi:hypothetical protein